MAREELIFSDYLRVVLRHKWYVVICLLLTLLLTYFLAGRETPVFESKTRIKIHEDELERADNPLKVDRQLPKPAMSEPTLDDVTTW